MFDTFGEFDSAEEMNKAAAGQLAQGDTQAIRDIARENGLDPADAEDYIDGEVTELCNPLMAALGKIKIEEDELKPVEIVQDWINYIKAQVTRYVAQILINRQPIAYDVDKVVEQLEELRKECEDPLQDYDQNYFIDKAIEITKGGGVDGN